MVKSSGVHIFPIVQGAQTISTKLLAQIFYVEHNDSAQIYDDICFLDSSDSYVFSTCRCEHPDYEPLKAALSCMRDIATLINERKRKMESMEKLVAWQESVQDWEVSLT